MFAEPFSPQSQILLVVFALLALIVVACFAPVLVRVLLLAQAVYWALSFVLRPLVQLSVNPTPQYADSIADPRLSELGYPYAIAHALHPVAVGIWIYVVVVAVYVACHRRMKAGIAVSEAERTGWQSNSNLVPTLAVAYVVGLLARLTSIATGSAGSAGDVSSSNPYLDVLAGVGSLGALGLIIYYRSSRRGATVAILLPLLIGELVWGIMIESKTPMLGAALAIAIRFAIEGFTRRRLITVGAGAVGVGLAFGWLQSFKVTAADEMASSLVASAYPAPVQPLLSIIRRFDLFEASTDVYYMNGRSWISPDFAVTNMFKNLLPSQLGIEKFQSGTRWAQEVRGSSVDMRNVSVSLAEGHINEGLLLGGYLGVLIESAFVLAVLVAVTKMLQSRFIFLIALGISLVAVPTVFERGALGITETLGKGLQGAVVVWVLSIVVIECRNRIRVRREPAEVSLSHVQATAPNRERAEQWA
ncbi:UNVERIFIED_CONTAM: hypothetical protein DES50_101220 [Williamsia faeni]